METAKCSDGGGSWETTPLEDISYSNVAVAEDFQLMLSAGTTDGAVYGVLSNGGTSSYVPFLQAGVVSGGNEDAGKAFVKTLLGKEAGASSNGIPVNEAALKDQINALMGRTETSMAFNRDGSDKMYTIEHMLQQINIFLRIAACCHVNLPERFK